MDPTGPISLARDIWRGRRDLSFKIYADRRMVMPMVGIGTRIMALPDPPKDIVIRVVNTGGTPVEVDIVGLELADGELIEFDKRGEGAVLLEPPRHLERWEPRDSLRARIGERGLNKMVAIGTDDHRYEGSVPKEWRDGGSWPE